MVQNDCTMNCWYKSSLCTIKAQSQPVWTLISELQSFCIQFRTFSKMCTMNYWYLIRLCSLIKKGYKILCTGNCWYKIVTFFWTRTWLFKNFEIVALYHELLVQKQNLLLSGSTLQRTHIARGTGVIHSLSRITNAPAEFLVQF